MYRYKYDKSYNHKSRKAHRRVVLAALVSVIVVGAIGYIAYDVLQQSLHPQAPVSRANYSMVQGESVNLFSTPYFQFQTDSSWKEITGEQKDGHYVYRSYKSTLVVRDLIIEINKSPTVLALSRTTHVFPVSSNPEGTLTAQGGGGDHCKTLMPKNAPALPTIVKQRQVTFACTLDASVYQAAVGLVGGSTEMVLTRPNGSKATYTITYRDLTVTPTDANLRNIVSSFQVR